MKAIYFYSRVSTTSQVSGSGLTRQRSDELGARLSVEHNLPIHTKPLVDGGKSAYHGRHIEKGVFGQFIAAIEAGEVESGSILIVESLDRISRQKPNLAQSLMLQIINAGVKIYTAIDNVMYSEDDPDLMSKLILSVLKLSLAYEESHKKSIRATSNVRIAVDAFLAGDKSVIIPSGKMPVFVDRNKKNIPERVRHIKRMIELRKQGYGYSTISYKLHEEIGENLYSPDGVARMLKQKALYGEMTVNISGQSFVLEDYYTPVISKTDFLSIHPSKKKISSTSTNKACMLTGIGITRCGCCGYAIASRYCKTTTNLRVMCESAYSKKVDCKFSVNGYQAEYLVLQLCADKVFTEVTESTEHDEKISSLELQLSDLQSKLLVLEDVPLMFIQKVSTLEKELATAKQEKLDQAVELIQIKDTEWDSVPKSTIEVKNLTDHERIVFRNKLQLSVENIVLIKHKKHKSVEIVFKDGDVRKGAFRGKSTYAKFFVDAKSVVDKDKLRMFGLEICDHYEELINGFPVVEVPNTILDSL